MFFLELFHYELIDLLSFELLKLERFEDSLQFRPIPSTSLRSPSLSSSINLLVSDELSLSKSSHDSSLKRLTFSITKTIDSRLEDCKWKGQRSERRGEEGKGEWEGS